jgi:tRNA-Thr(GGU) m(6)t(6)A37 methyltransferase TsaA
MDDGYRFDPIGFVRSPFTERARAPRQAAVGRGAGGTIELVAGRGYEHALEGLEGWEYAWVLFVFHRNVEQGRGWKPKVLPPRAGKKQGVFATRSPHRPNPIGLSAVAIERVEGLVVHVVGLDLLDGTPVLDLKPYVAYADSFPHAGAGWLEARDPLPPWEVVLAHDAARQLAWLAARGVELRGPIEAALSLGPEPRPYRRIRRRGEGLELAVKEWRVDFASEPAHPAGPGAGSSLRAGRLVVAGVRSGYRPRDLAGKSGLEVHREFVALFQAARL